MNSLSKWSLEPTQRALEASDLLARIPRLLRFRLAGREDRLLLRLAQRLGFEGGASIEISAEVAALFESATVDVDQPRATFQEDTGVQAVLDEANGLDLFSDARALVASEEALRALYVGLGLCPAAP